MKLTDMFIAALVGKIIWQNYKYSQLSNCLILQKAAAPLNGHVLSQQQNHGQNFTQNFLDSGQPI